jgi:DNA-binding transcriptional MerR regulator/effector-binding domain-containing protein
MLKIGDFSKICQTSIKALRHWDAVGLLKPALIDPETNYRYYSIEQIDDVNRILVFRTLGLSLSETARLLHEQPTPDDIRAMLLAKRTEVMTQIQEAEATLKALEGRLRVMDRQQHTPPYEVVLKSVEEVPILSVRTVVPDLQGLVNLLLETHPYARQKDNSNLLAVWHDEGYEVETVDVEIGFPVESRASKPISLKHDLQLIPSLLLAVPLVASTIHLGEWLTLSEAYIHLGQWIDQNGYMLAGAGRELFHHIDWEVNQRATVTELQFPIVERR